MIAHQLKDDPISICLEDSCEVTVKKNNKGESVLDRPCTNYSDPDCHPIKTGN